MNSEEEETAATETAADPTPQASATASPACGCGHSGPTAPGYVYAIGRIRPQIPNAGVEKELAQVMAGADTGGLTDSESLHAVLSDSQNRYLVRQMCWVFAVEGIDTYLVQPRDPVDFDVLVETLRPATDSGDVDVLIGRRGEAPPPEYCNGLVLPTVGFDQIYSFDRASIIAALPLPEKMSEEKEKRYRSGAGEVFDQVTQISDNTGASDQHRAVNYLAVRYPRLYSVVTDAFQRNVSFTGLDFAPSSLAGARTIIDVIVNFQHRETAVTERMFARVDTTEEFPFLVTPMQPLYER
ncbi:hypothetical protein ACIOHR_37590 [Streptomyces anulatus]